METRNICNENEPPSSVDSLVVRSFFYGDAFLLSMLS